MKKVLFLVKNIDEINEVIKFSKVFKEKYNYVELDVLYVRDVMKYDLFPSTIEGVGVQGTMNILLQEYKAMENKNFNQLELEMKDKFNCIYSKEGETVEIALEEMKAYDLLVIVKNEILSNTLKDLLRYHYKPLLILAKTDDEYKYDLSNVLMLNDGQTRANKSLYLYYLNFMEQPVNVLRVNVEEQDRLFERYGKNCNLIDKIGDKNSIILEEIQKYGLIIMGDLQFSVFIEKLAGNIGIKVIQKAKCPIFIG